MSALQPSLLATSAPNHRPLPTVALSAHLFSGLWLEELPASRPHGLLKRPKAGVNRLMRKFDGANWSIPSSSMNAPSWRLMPSIAHWSILKR